MSKLALIGKIKELYNRGENVMEFLKQESGDHNDVESIMISYDFQAGSYTKLAKQNSDYLEHYTDAVKSVFSDFSEFSTIMEIGVGEATLMNPLMAKIDPQNKKEKFGFDISWSRTRYARQNTEMAGNVINLFMANLFEIPLPNNAIDIIYTSHSLEPNGGKEKEALRELYRVANKYIVLLEPDFNSATLEGKERMARHGYVRDLAKHAVELGYEVVVERPFDISINPLNPTALTIIKKNHCSEQVKPSFICPVTKTVLSRSDSAYFSEESGLIYPIIDGIPCLLDSAAILGLHFSNFCALK
jgi:ubiquinone/menaquinone biosynthesis C-methylase UbiE